MSRVHFWKGQALGNDYLIVDAAELAAPFTPQHAVRLCDRHRGAGSDGVLVADLATRPFRLRIINPDGSEIEKSGNGLRIFGAFVHDRGLSVRHEWFDVQLMHDVVALRVEDELAAGALLIRARMGRARFDGAAVGFTAQPAEALDVELPLPLGGSARVNTVSLSNPHCVVFVDRLEREDFLRRAPQLCMHRAFAAGTNVQFARVTGERTLEAWIWERGVGETLASGSSACAVAAATVRRGFAAPGAFVVHMPGGHVDVTVRPDYDIELLGPAQLVYEGWIRGAVLD